MDTLKTKLSKYYNDDSKHSRYQNIPDFVKEETGYEEELIPLWRSDIPRYHYLLEVLKELDFKTLADVGANTGYFSISLANKMPSKNITAVELNPNHLDFISIIQDHYKMANLSTANQALDIGNVDTFDQVDALLYFNVIHHAGSDYDAAVVPSLEVYEDYCIDFMHRLSKRVKYIFFQMGSNWGGNKKTPIIPLDDDAGKYLFIQRIMEKAGWNIERVAYAKIADSKDRYEYFEHDEEFLNNLSNRTYLEKELDAEVLKTQSEFFRRPIFVCQSKNA